MRSPTDPIVDVFRRSARRLEPLPTGVSPRLVRLDGVRAVLFDVYGTLLISGSGDIGTEEEAGRVAAVAGAWTAMRLSFPAPPDRIGHLHEEAILRHHAAARDRGIEFPEVDIVEIWREVLRELMPRDLMPRESGGEASGHIDVYQLAAEYEARVNPVWPMPGMVECLGRLHALGLLLGVISNAQFYTPQVFPALTGLTLDQLGMDAELQFYSHAHGQAKPGGHLYEMARRALETRGVQPSEVLYVGNDLLKDVVPAAQVGFRTALYAGDARSLRLREGDQRVAGVEPDIVLTELMQILQCVGRGRP